MVDDNKARKAPNDSTGTSEAAQQYLVQIYSYRGIILQISQQLLDTSLYTLASNQIRLENYEKQIIDVIRNLEYLGRAPAGVKFNKRAVLGALNNARDELGMALFLLNTSDPEKAAKGVKNITRCRGYLNLALQNIPSK